MVKTVRVVRLNVQHVKLINNLPPLAHVKQNIVDPNKPVLNKPVLFNLTIGIRINR